MRVEVESRVGRACCSFLVIALTLVPIIVIAQPSTGFLQNRGQLDDTVLYYASGPAVSIFLTREAIVLDVKEETERNDCSNQLCCHSGALGSTPAEAQRRGWSLWIEFAGGRPSPAVSGRDELPVRHNFFLGSDPSEWRTDVPSYEQVIYRELWWGIDLTLHLEQGALVYESNGPPDRIRFRYEGAEGAVACGERTDLIQTPRGKIEIRHPRPGESRGMISWESAAGDGDRYDPDLLWSTFIGGNDFDTGEVVALNADGNLVIAGYSQSVNFPVTAGAYDETHNGQRDVCIFEMSADGSQLLWSTFLGGLQWDRAFGMALDSSDNILFAGQTDSPDYPTTPGAYDETLNGGADVFVSKLNPTGSELLWSTYVGGTDNEIATSLVLDELGNPVMTGHAHAGDYPTTPGAYDETFNGGSIDVFVTKLDGFDSAMIWSTFLGGDAGENGGAIVLDLSENPLVTGGVASSDFPTTPGAYDTSLDGEGDLFVAKLSASGSDLLWSTFVGGSSDEDAWGLALDDDENPTVVGYTNSEDFPTTEGAFDETFNGDDDVCVFKLGAMGDVLHWGSYVGGSDIDWGLGLILDIEGNPILTGRTMSTDFPTTPGGFDGSFNGGDDVFVARLDASGGVIHWGTYLGGSAYERGRGLALDISGNLVVTANTESPEFPTTEGAYDESYNGGSADAYVASFRMSGVSGLDGFDPPESASQILRISPNPFTGSATIHYGLPREDRVSVSVHDVSGRLVRLLLADRIESAGRHSMLWNGRDDEGRRAAPGVYFVRFGTGEGVWSRRMIVSP